MERDGRRSELCLKCVTRLLPCFRASIGQAPRKEDNCDRDRLAWVGAIKLWMLVADNGLGGNRSAMADIGKPLLVARMTIDRSPGEACPSGIWVNIPHSGPWAMPLPWPPGRCSSFVKNGDDRSP